MSRDIWVISDTHFDHANIIKYCNRPFNDVQEMNEAMIKNWNEVVKDQDIVYHCGDVGFKNSDHILCRLNGRKRLILGNHDDGKDPALLKHFQKITCWRFFKEFGGMLLTHVPVHPFSLEGKFVFNVHGHIHDKTIKDGRFVNVCVEHTNYAPVNIEELRKYGSR